LIEKKLSWRPREPLNAGLRKLYPWILARVQAIRQQGTR
jgi:dTDP-D-glucose 4,6-dehydratase